MVCILSRKTSTDSILLRKELPPRMLLVDMVLRSNLFPLQHLVQRRWAILDALFCISEGFYFGLFHLIMASLIHFEEKVHRKKLQRADTIPLLFPRLLCQILEYMSFSIEPRLERHRLCREWFTLDKWNQLMGYYAPLGAFPMIAPPVLLEPEQGELPTKTAPPVPTPEATSTAPPTNLTVTPVAPTTSEPSITISALEFRSRVHTF